MKKEIQQLRQFIQRESEKVGLFCTGFLTTKTHIRWFLGIPGKAHSRFLITSQTTSDRRREKYIRRDIRTIARQLKELT